MPGKRCTVQPCPSHVMGKFCVWDRRCILPVQLLRTSQHSYLHQKPLTPTDLSARAQGVPRGLSGLVEAGSRRHGLSPGCCKG